MPVLTRQQVDEALDHYALLLNELTIGDSCPDLRVELQEAIGDVMGVLRDGHIVPHTDTIDVDDTYEELAQRTAEIGAEFDQCVGEAEAPSGSGLAVVGIFAALGGVLIWDILRRAK